MSCSFSFRILFLIVAIDLLDKLIVVVDDDDDDVVVVVVGVGVAVVRIVGMRGEA